MEIEADASAASPAREATIQELVSLGWARAVNAGQLEVASGLLLESLAARLGAHDARVHLIDLALKTLLLGFEFREAAIDPIDAVDTDLANAYELFQLDETRVATACAARASDADLLAELEALRAGGQCAGSGGAGRGRK